MQALYIKGHIFNEPKHATGPLKTNTQSDGIVHKLNHYSDANFLNVGPKADSAAH